MHCTNALHWRTAPTHCTDKLTYRTHQTQTKIKTKCQDSRQTTNARQGARQRDYSQTVAMTQLFFPQLNRELRMDQLTNHRDTRPKVETDWPTTETQDQGQTENKWHKTVYTTQLSDRPPIHALNPIWEKKSFISHFEITAHKFFSREK